MRDNSGVATLMAYIFCCWLEIYLVVVAELEDAIALDTIVIRRVGSSPTYGILY